MSSVCQKCGRPFGPACSPYPNIFSGRILQYWCGDYTGAGQAALKAHAAAGYPSSGPVADALAATLAGGVIEIVRAPEEGKESPNEPYLGFCAGIQPHRSVVVGSLHPDELAALGTARCGACGHLLMLHHNEWCCDGDCCGGQSCNVGDCKCSGEKWQGASSPDKAFPLPPLARQSIGRILLSMGKVMGVHERALPKPER